VIISYDFFALRFTFFAAFFASRSSDVEAEVPREELSTDDNCTGVASSTFLVVFVVWGVN
jgi:hypothetical protein